MSVAYPSGSAVTLSGIERGSSMHRPLGPIVGAWCAQSDKRAVSVWPDLARRSAARTRSRSPLGLVGPLAEGAAPTRSWPEARIRRAESRHLSRREHDRLRGRLKGDPGAADQADVSSTTADPSPRANKSTELRLPSSRRGANTGRLSAPGERNAQTASLRSAAGVAFGPFVRRWRHPRRESGATPAARRARHAERPTMPGRGA
jgi:hypothetical protein